MDVNYTLPVDASPGSVELRFDAAFSYSQPLCPSRSLHFAAWMETAGFHHTRVDPVMPVNTRGVRFPPGFTFFQVWRACRDRSHVHS